MTCTVEFPSIHDAAELARKVSTARSTKNTASPRHLLARRAAGPGPGLAEAARWAGGHGTSRLRPGHVRHVREMKQSSFFFKSQRFQDLKKHSAHKHQPPKHIEVALRALTICFDGANCKWV